MTFAPIQDQLNSELDNQAPLHQFFLKLIRRKRNITPAKSGEGYITTNTTSDSESQGDSSVTQTGQQ